MTSFFDYFIGYTVSLHVEAQNMMAELATFEGALKPLIFPLPEPESFTHTAWEKGTNSSSGSKALRIVMPLAMFCDIVEKADLSIFTSKAGGVECRPDQLRFPHHEVRFLNWKFDQKFEITQVQRDVPADQRKIHCKTIELPLNYHERMQRYQFRVPPKGDLDDEKWREKCNRYLQKWIDLIITEKKRQMQMPIKCWPPWPPRSAVKNVMTMPMVVWLSKPKKPPAVPFINKRNSRFGIVSGEHSC